MVGAMTLALQAAQGAPRRLLPLGEQAGWSVALLGAAAGVAVGLALGRAMR